MTDKKPAPLLDLPAVATRLGVNHRHIRRLVAERRIPFLKWGHLLRFDPPRDRGLARHDAPTCEPRLVISSGMSILRDDFRDIGR